MLHPVNTFFKVVILISLAALLPSCVSRSSYRMEVERRIALEKAMNDKNEEITHLEDTVETYKARLNETEAMSILECRARLDGCLEAKAAHARTIDEIEQKALYKGMLTVWQSLSIEAQPEVEGRVFKDHYLKLTIKIKDQPVYYYRVKTDNPEGGFSSAFSSLFSVTSLFSILF
ncbi:MAG TPA: hypothetical protein VJL89_03960 [Thermodesulfovibrionia bacterium]|nr:hypothetical protein [Thermodesulfovibrionia bacterium]